MATLSKTILAANGIVQSSKELSDLYCAICTNDSSSEDWQKHTVDPRHVETLQRFNVAFGTRGTATVYCKACHAQFNWNKLKEHAESHKIKPWYVGQDLYKKFFDNHVLTWGDQLYYCYPCDAIFSERFTAFCHIEDETHYKSMKTVSRPHEDFSLSGTGLSYQLLVHNGLASFGAADVRCRICNCNSICFANVIQHIAGTKHTKSIRTLIDVLKERKDRELRTKEISPSSKTKELSKKRDKAGKPMDSLKDKVVSKSAEQKLLSIYVVESGGTRFCCKICDVKFNDYSTVDDHVAGQTHALALKKYGCENISLTKNGNDYYCRSCDYTITNSGNMYGHIKGKKHMTSMNQSKSIEEIPPTAKSSIEPPIPKTIEIVCNPAGQKILCDYIVQLDGTKFGCKLCDVELTGSSTIKDHVTGQKHAQALKKYGCKSILLTNKGNNYYCRSCDCLLPSCDNVYSHIKGTKHMSSMSQPKSIEEIPPTAKSSTEPPIPKTVEIVCNTAGQKMLCDYIVQLDGTKFGCKLCDVELTGSSTIKDHVTGQKHAQALKKYGCKSILLTNKGNDYYCRSCDCLLPSCDNVYSHIKGKKHMSSVNNIVDSGIETTAKRSSIVVENLKKAQAVRNRAGLPLFDDYIVKLAGTQYHCKVCDVKISGLSNVNSHINGQSHALALKKYGCKNICLNRSGKYYHCTSCNCRLPGHEGVYNHIKGKRHISSLENKQEISNKVEIGKKTENLPNTASQIVPCNYIVKLGNKASCCKICDLEFIGSRTIDDHLAGKQHKKALKKFGCNNISLKDGHYYCECCRCKVSGLDNVYLHVRGNRHFISLKISERRELQASKKIANDVPNGRQSQLKTLQNGELSRLFSGMEITKKRRTRKPRSKRKRQKNIPIAQTNCNVCNASVDGCADLHTHLASHFSEGFDRSNIDDDGDDKINNTSKTEENEHSDSASLRSMTANGSTPQTQPDFAFHDNNVNNIAKKSNATKSKLFDMGNETSEQSSDDENLSFPESLSTGDDTAINNSERKQRSPIKSKMRNIADTLESDIDYIYDMTDKLREIEFGVKLSLIIDARNMYCLICQKAVANTLQDYYEHLCSLDHCDYLDEMENDHILFENVPEQFSARDLASQYMEEISDDTVRCLICDEKIENNESALRDHINDERHEKSCEQMRATAKRNFEEIKSRRCCDWYNVKGYWCVPCAAKVECEASFAKHLKSKQHANVVKKLANTKSQMIYDCCTACALLWYGKRSSCVDHFNDPTHKWLKRDGHYLCTDLPIIAANRLVALEKYIDDKIAYLDRASAQEFEKVKVLISDMEEAVKLKFQHSKAYAFGSRVSGLASMDSDIDVFLDCGNTYNGKKNLKNEIVRVMTDVQQCLSKYSQFWKVQEVLPNCRSPLMKVYHISTGLSCDISFENGLSVENTKMIKCFNDTFPLCRRMILFLKQWLEDCELSGSERISSYTMYWLVIFYLQKETILPSIATLIAMRNESRTIAGWEVGVTHDFTYNEADSNFSIKELLVRFFTFYGHFDYRYDVACPIIGDVVKKRTFTDIHNLPKEMAPYFAYMKNSRDPEPFRIDSPMCIQDPFDLPHNITKAVNKVFLNRFRTYCFKSLDVLCSSEVS